MDHHLIRLWKAQRRVELDRLRQLRQASGSDEDLFRLVGACRKIGVESDAKESF